MAQVILPAALLLSDTSKSLSHAAVLRLGTSEYEETAASHQFAKEPARKSKLRHWITLDAPYT